MRSRCLCRVDGVREVGRNIHVLRFHAPDIAASVRPGQFVGIRVNASTEPLLRRPFSVYSMAGEDLEVIFHVVGKGTSSLSVKKPGDTIDVLGPLGTPFGVTGGFDTALLVAGGLGLAPLPMLTAALRQENKTIVTFLGARTSDQIVETHLHDVHVATDDGSRGMQATVVDLVDRWIEGRAVGAWKMFGCGPNAMLRVLAATAQRCGIPCEVSLEGPMACGFGLCQGCPVELIDGSKPYALMCSDGPVFDVRRVRIPG